MDNSATLKIIVVHGASWPSKVDPIFRVCHKHWMSIPYQKLFILKEGWHQCWLVISGYQPGYQPGYQAGYK
jgi:hypothetical protein